MKSDLLFFQTDRCTGCQLCIMACSLTQNGSCGIESAHIQTVGQLVQMTEADLLKVRSFGKTSLREIRRKLADMGLTLGMTDID